MPDEVRHDPTIVGVHARSIGVEYSHDTNIDVIHAVVVHEQRFSDPFSFVIARANTDGIDISPVTFRLRMHLWITIDFAGAGLQNPGTAPLGHPQDIDGPHDRCFHRLDRIVLIVPRCCRTSQVVDLIDLQIDRQSNIVANELEIGFPKQVKDIGLLRSEKVIHA